MSFKEYLKEVEGFVEKIPMFAVFKDNRPIFSSSDEAKARKFYEEQPIGPRPSQWVSLWTRLEERGVKSE
jgi:hypothetical protein